MRRRTPLIVIACVMGLTAAACSSNTSTSSKKAAGTNAKINVVTNFYPIEWIAQRIGGDAAEISDLTPQGSEPHDLTLDAKRIEKMRNADIVLYLGNDFQPEVQKAANELPAKVVAKDLLTAPGIDLQPAPDALGDEVLGGHLDPHVWLDPIRMEALAKAASDTFKMARPNQATTFDANLQSTLADLASLDQFMKAKLTGCANRTLVTSHAAFGYLSSRYGLEQLPIAGFSPEEEPDPQTLKQISDLAKARGVTTIYVEEALSPKVAKTVADEVGAKTVVLATLEFAPESKNNKAGDYITAQRDNAERLAIGLHCTS